MARNNWVGYSTAQWARSALKCLSRNKIAKGSADPGDGDHGAALGVAGLRARTNAS